MHLTDVDLGWLAGILDGEGWFRLSASNTPIIGLAMTDLDTVQKVAAMFGGRNITVRNRSDERKKYLGNKWKPCYGLTLNGEAAKDIMLALLGTGRLSARRTAKIQEVLAGYDARPVKRLTKLQVIDLRNDFIGGMNSKELSKKYGITPEKINYHLKDIRDKQEQDLQDAIVADYKAGMTRHAIADKYQLHYETITRRLIKAGFADSARTRSWQTRRQRMQTPESIDAIVADAKAGLTRKELAAKYNLDKETVGRIQRKAGVYDPVGLRRWQTRRQGV